MPPSSGAAPTSAWAGSAVSAPAPAKFAVAAASTSAAVGAAAGGAIITAPFERDDLFGTFGLAPQTWQTQLRLRILYCTLVPIKAVLCIALILFYYVVCVLGNALLPDPLRTNALVLGGKVLTRAALFCLGYFHIGWLYVAPDGSTSSSPPATPGGPVAVGGYVSNHSR